MNRLRGTGVALVTPFTADQSVDFDSLKELLDHTAKGGVDYYVVLGTTGESATLSLEEKKQVLDFVRKNNSAGLPIVFGFGGNNTHQLIRDLAHYDFEGVDALLSVSPYYNKPSQEGIYRHFKALADESPVPVLLYNVPGRTGSCMSSSTTLELAKHRNIIGIKEASGDLDLCMRIARDKSKDFVLLSGDDMLTPAMIAMGAEGVISVLANGLPEEMSNMVNASLKHDFGTAQRYLYNFLGVNPLMYSESNPVGIKELLHQKGVCANTVRLPLADASEALRQRIAEELEAMNG